MDKRKELLGVVLEFLVNSESMDKPSNPQIEKRMIGDYVIVRCNDAGVHAGFLADYYDRTVVLKDSKRLWYFKCKEGHSLSGVALHGLDDGSKITGEVKEVILTEACEILSVTEQAKESIRNAAVYNPK